MQSELTGPLNGLRRAGAKVAGTFRTNGDGAVKTHETMSSAGRLGAPRLIKRLLAGTVLLAASDAAAQATDPGRSIFGTSEVVTFSVLIGVISAAMISAIWLIRQRGNIEAENRELRSNLSDGTSAFPGSRLSSPTRTGAS